jgi:hypothetical protein
MHHIANAWDAPAAFATRVGTKRRNVARCAQHSQVKGHSSTEQIGQDHTLRIQALLTSIKAKTTDRGADTSRTTPLGELTAPQGAVRNNRIRPGQQVSRMLSTASAITTGLKDDPPEADTQRTTHTGQLKAEAGQVDHADKYWGTVQEKIRWTCNTRRPILAACCLRRPSPCATPNTIENI